MYHYYYYYVHFYNTYVTLHYVTYVKQKEKYDYVRLGCPLRTHHIKSFKPELQLLV